MYIAYHDTEWGVPNRRGQELFAMLNLEGAQAGLSWRTILHRRAGYHEVFENFDVPALARWKPSAIERALKNRGIVRNRLKVAGVVRNARAVQAHFDGDLDAFGEFLWSFVNHEPVRNAWAAMGDVPPRTAASDLMSRELKRRDFTFVGSTICHAFMQAVGMVNDHLTSCFRWRQIRK